MKIKNVLSVVLAVCMLFSMITVSFAKTADGYDVTPISFSYFKDGTYEDALSLEGGKELVAEVSVSKEGDAKNLIFALVVYSEDVMYDFETVTKSVSAEEVDFMVKASVPEDVSDCYAVAFLWDGIGTMNNITNSALFPMGSTGLESLLVDGVSVEGFETSKKTYNVSVASTKVQVPEIEATPIDAGVKVDVEHFVDVFPGKSVITVTNAKGEESIYTVNYTCSEKLVSNLTILDDNTIPDKFGGGTVSEMPAYHQSGFSVGKTAYSDREQYFVQAITDESLIGCDYITGAISWYNGKGSATEKAFTSNDILPWINFDIKRSATVNVFHYQNKNQFKFEDYGFTLSVSEDKKNGYFRCDLNDGKERPHIYKYSKHFNAGDKVSIPNSSDNDNTYSVIIQYDGFEIPEVPNYTALSSITIDGVPYEEFDAKVFDMNLSIAADAVDKPVVTAEAAFEGAEVTIEEPQFFPGKTVITVSKDGEEDSVYTLNWMVDGGLISDIKLNEDISSFTYDGANYTTALPAFCNELKAGSKAFADRDFPVEQVNGADYENMPYMAIPLSWQNAHPWRAGVYTSGVVEDWLSFKVNRDVVVRILKDTYNASGNDDLLTAGGYTYKEYKSDIPVTVNVTANDTHPTYQYEFKKSFKAGSVVNIPNIHGGQVYFVVFDFADYGEVSEPENPTALKNITVDGVALNGFSKDVLTYEMTVDSAAISAPQVVATAEEGATVTVVDPVVFPGKTVITVSKENCEDTEYVINWKSSKALVSDIAVSEDYARYTYNNGTKDVTVTAPVPVYREKLTAGEKAYADKDYLVEEVNGAEYKDMPFLAIPLSWQNGAPWRDGVYNANYIEDWISFKVNRNATVRIIKDVYKTTNNDNKLVSDYGFTYKKYTEYVPVVVNVHANNTHPDYVDEFSKKVNAGDTVTIPNIYDGQVYFVVFNFADYGEIPDPEPTATTALTSITVDGVELDGFNKETLTYEAIVDPMADAAPAVEATAETEGAGVTVADATTFPGKTTITVSVDGVEDTVYTINWKTEENLVSDITILQDNTIPAEFGGGNVSVMPGYLPGGFEIGALAYADRATRPVPTYRVKDTAEDSFLGCDYITGCIGWYNGSTPTIKAFKSDVCMPWINFTVARGATVNVLMYKNTYEQRFTDYGYELTTSSDTDTGYLLTELNDGKQRPHIYKFSKHFNAGERVSIPNANDNDNTYCAVIVYDDYGVEQELSANPTALKSITVDGNNLYTFVPDVKEITATIDVDATAAPAIEATPMDGEATVAVTNPDTFPGKTVITVSKENCEDTEYVINWKSSNALVSDIAVSEDYARYTYNNGTKDVTVTAPVPVYREKLTAGEKAYADKDYLVEEVNGAEYKDMPFLAIPLSWQNGAPWRDGVYNANYIEDWISFKVNRNATVRIIKDVYKTTNNDNKLVDDFGFTYKKYTEYVPVIVNVHANNTHPDYVDEFSKTVNAGDTVTIPNIYDGQVYFVVFDFEGYTE